MITRDDYNFIVQHPDMDGGDTLSRMSMMAISGSRYDRDKLFLFKKGPELVRHPAQAKWNDPDETSRDQVVPALMTGEFPEQAEYYVNKGFVNKDFLDWGVRWAICEVYGIKKPLSVKLVGKMNLKLSLLWNCFVDPDHEQNQFACICIALGKDWALTLTVWHPDIRKNISGYFSGWRDQPELGDALINQLFRTAYPKKDV